ncbi:predicted protein [Postia placenta Mad-698-R]|nr:predicted protein [Postia placenta Mad-698-R]
MSLPASPPDKEILKHLFPLRYDGKTVIECNRFLSQLRMYWIVNTSLTTIELKVQVALSLLDGNAHTWATPTFAQLASVQISTQGATTPFTDEAAFATTFKACFGHLDDEAAAQVELAKLCADKPMREKCTTCCDLRSSDRGKPKSWGRSTSPYRSDGEQRSNLRLGTRNVLVSKGTEVAGSSP